MLTSINCLCTSTWLLLHHQFNRFTTKDTCIPLISLMTMISNHTRLYSAFNFQRNNCNSIHQTQMETSPCLMEFLDTITFLFPLPISNSSSTKAMNYVIRMIFRNHYGMGILAEIIEK